MQGLTYSEVERLKPEIRYLKIGGDFHSLNPPGGESFAALHGRAHRFFHYLYSNYRNVRVLVVAHEVFLQQFHGVLRGETWRESLRWAVHNLTLTTFVMGGQRLLSESRDDLFSRCRLGGLPDNKPG